MYQYLKLTTTDQIAHLTLNRPDKRNAMNGEMIQELSQALDHIAHDDHVRVLVITGEGNHFCAGADILWMQKIAAGSYNDNYDDAQRLADLMFQLYSFTKPTIVLAHGTTVGGGLGLLAACDIAIAANDAAFGFGEVKIGITPSTISPYVIAAIGERMAHYYFLTGERFDAKEAQRVNLIHRVTEKEELLNTGFRMAKELLQNNSVAMMQAKHLIRDVAKEKMTTELAQKTAEHLANLRSTPEAQAGLRSFTEKKSS